MIRNITILLFLIPLFSFSQEEFIQFNCNNKYYKAQGYVNTFDFKSFSWINNDPKTIKAVIQFDLTSISEKNEKLVKHLKDEDFFNVEIFPTANLVIDSINSLSDTAYIAKGSLTVKDIQKPISLTFNYNPQKNQVIGYGSFSRYDFNVNPNNKGIDENILITFQVNLPNKNLLGNSINSTNVENIDSTTTNTSTGH